MDMMTLIGLVSVMGTLYYVLATDEIVRMLFNPNAAILVFGGTFSATLVAFPWEVIKETIPSFRLLFFSNRNSERHRQELVEQITGLSEKARRSGIESLQEEIPRINDKHLAYGIQMAVDGIEQEVIRNNMEKEALYTRQRHRHISSVFRTMATLAPVFGLLGTLLGVVKMLQNISNPVNMGTAMASAVTATFYGILAANVCIPIAIKLNDHSDRDMTIREIVTEGVLAIQQGDLPLIVRKKLNAFVLSSIREKSQPQKKD